MASFGQAPGFETSITHQSAITDIRLLGGIGEPAGPGLESGFSIQARRPVSRTMPKHSWRQAFAVYSHPRVLALFLLGFASSLPYMLVFSTLSVWLREAGIARQTIGFASLIGLAYAFKWVWALMLDEWRLPLLGALGRRRSWLVLTQCAIALGLFGMALADPQQHLQLIIVLAVLVAFASATQDIAIDAYRLEIADDSQQAALAAAYMTGYRIAGLLAGAGALLLAEWLGSSAKHYSASAWGGTYLVFALLMLPGLLTSLWMREPTQPARSDKASHYGLLRQLLSVLALIVLLFCIPALVSQLLAIDWSAAGLLPGLGKVLLYVAVIALCLSRPGRHCLAPVLTPVADFIARYRWQALLMLGLAATYRMSDTVMGVMANVFYIDLGFSKEQIAGISKLFGLVMTLLGAFSGGLLIARFPLLPVLFLGGLASAATNLLFSLLASVGPDQTLLIATISADNFSAGLASTAFVAYLSSLTNLEFSASQYALLSSVMLLLPRLLGGYSGVMVEHLGYNNFFLVTALLGLPTLVLIIWQWCLERRQKKNRPAQRQAVESSSHQ